MQLFILLLTNFLLLTGSHCETGTKTDDDKGPGKFEYTRKEPGNELGIYTKVIAQVFRPANQKTEEYRINRDYMTDDVHNGLMRQCQSADENSALNWKGCVLDSEGLFAYAEWGITEPMDKTVTYLEIRFQAYARYANDEEQFCLLEEVYQEKVYVCLHTFSQASMNDTLPRSYFDPVTVHHHYLLDSIGENFLSLFEDKIDRDAVYNFGKDEYTDKDSPYECLLAISSSASKDVIEEKCNFFCVAKSGRLRKKGISSILVEGLGLYENEIDVKHHEDLDDIIRQVKKLLEL